MGNPPSRRRRTSTVLRIDPAVRNAGHHFVAMTTSPALFPNDERAEERVCSDVPQPYASAVSNQLTPPSMLFLTISRAMGSASSGQYLPISPGPLLNCQQPSPMGLTRRSDEPSVRNGIIDRYPANSSPPTLRKTRSLRSRSTIITRMPRADVPTI